MKKLIKKWDKVYQNANIDVAKPCSILKDFDYLLPDPKNGALIGLDLACGRAGNAIFLAEKGFEVDAIDISPIVLKQVETFAQANNLKINGIEKDIEAKGLENKKYDIIIVSYFLNRSLFPQIISALKANGLLYYQTWSQLRCDNFVEIERKGPSNPAFRLDAGELINLSAPLRMIYYQENGLLGNLQQGLRNEALLIAQKIN